MSLESSEAVLWASRLVIFSILYALQGYVPIVPFLVSKGEVGIILSTQGWASVAALMLGSGFGTFCFRIFSEDQVLFLNDWTVLELMTYSLLRHFHFAVGHIFSGYQLALRSTNMERKASYSWGF